MHINDTVMVRINPDTPDKYIKIWALQALRNYTYRIYWGILDKSIDSTVVHTFRSGDRYKLRQKLNNKHQNGYIEIDRLHSLFQPVTTQLDQHDFWLKLTDSY
jgi:hypothetical protein